MKKASIIIPVYNGEKQIKRCLDSIVSQTYKNIEVIVVNDGSTDNTSHILKDYKNITVINKKNSGVSDSRNRGILEATGDYILFCDADDWYDENLVETCINCIDDADVLRFSYYFTDENEVRKKSVIDDILADKDMIIDDNKMLIENLLACKIDPPVFNSMYKKDFIIKNNIKFDKNVFYGEDLIFMLKVFLNVKNISVISKPLYYYYLNNSSVTRDYNSSLRNICSLPALRTTIFDVLGDEASNYLDFVNQLILNKLLIYFSVYWRDLPKNKYYNCFDVVFKNDYNLLLDLKKGNLNLKWKIFVDLILKKHKKLFRLYIKMYGLLNKK